jgi:hypothetical protein
MFSPLYCWWDVRTQRELSRDILVGLLSNNTASNTKHGQAMRRLCRVSAVRAAAQRAGIVARRGSGYSAAKIHHESQIPIFIPIFRDEALRAPRLPARAMTP